MSGPLKIYPSVEECQIKNKLICPIEDCGHIFTSESNLNLHLCKTHKTIELKVSPLEKWYFCPEAKCPWSNTKHFRNMKNLRQHFLKMHMAKMFSCLSCPKSFPSEPLLTKHSVYCDITFSCLDCKASYACYDTLKTHCRRKNHRILNKVDYKMRPTLDKTKTGNLLLPKKSFSEEITAECSKNVNKQTRVVKPVLETKTTQMNQIVVEQVTQQTQTGSKNHVFSVKTQTVENHKVKQEIIEENYKNMNTQTDLVESREISCNTSFDIEDFKFTLKNNIEKNTSSTQTHWPSEDIFNISTATHGTIHTDTSDLLSDSLSNFDTNFFNCNSQTQTDLMFENEIFNSDYYSNMYTQTCDEILSGLNGLTDIQTQTALHETLRSVESQTLMSSADKLCPNILKDIVHSETQTDVEFRQMFEIINS